MKRHSLVRPSDALLPAGFLIAALLPSAGMPALRLFLCCLLARLLALAAAPATRMAYAEQPSMRRAGGTLSLALLLQCAGGLLAIALCAALFPANFAAWAGLCAAGALLNIEHVFYEYLFAAGEARSAALCRAITAALTAAGLALGGEGALWPTAMALISAGVSAIIGVAIGGRPRGKIDRRLIGFAPQALIQSAAYCAVAAAACALRPFGDIQPFAPFCGLIAYELCRAPFRRSAGESRGMARKLAVAGGVALALGALCLMLRFAAPPLPPLVQSALPQACLMTLLGCACGYAVFGDIRRLFSRLPSAIGR